ncbi:MAG: glyoxalase, partial [Terrabacter sp.]
MITSLAYLGINSPKKDEWPEMATRFWGAMVTDPGPDGAVRLKFDDAQWRLQIHPGEQDETAYIGWGVDYEEDLDQVEKALADLG